ncbi:MAG: metallophosphoesterase [Candidatus Thorarchaeota archaeon]
MDEENRIEPIRPGKFYALAVTDVHLGYGKSDSDSFRAFIDQILEESEVEHFVIMGDFLDCWTKDNDRLLKKEKKTLEQLSELKSKGAIGELHYVVGNHDFVIEELQKDYPSLSAFSFKSPSCKDVDWLTLTTPSKPPKGFGFLHGHQLIEGEAGEIYNGVCKYLCSQGDLRGWISRILWDQKGLVPVLTAAIAFLLMYFAQYAWAILSAAATIISIVWVSRKGPDLSKLSAKSYDEQVEVLMHTIPWRKRRRIIRYFKKSPQQRRGTKLIELDTIKQARDRANLTGLDPQKTHQVFEQVLERALDSSGYKTMGAQVHRVLGHTHKEERNTNYANLGSWEKGRRHLVFVISASGQHRIGEWVWQPDSRWRGLLR